MQFAAKFILEGKIAIEVTILMKVFCNTGSQDLFQ